MPPVLEPMLATSGRPVAELTGWVAEPKLDGWRCQVLIDPFLQGGRKVRTRSGRDVTGNLSELDRLAELGVSAILDGELVAGAGELSDFYRAAPSMARRDRPSAGRQAADAGRLLLAACHSRATSSGTRRVLAVIPGQAGWIESADQLRRTTTRAAGAASAMDRPATVACHYLAVGPGLGFGIGYTRTTCFGGSGRTWYFAVR